MMSAADGADADPKFKLKSPENIKNVHHIAGIPVEFPYKPYATQFAFMCRVISTLNRALKEGPCNALLESPTGTGKSLSLLCATLAWQQNCKIKNLWSNLSQSTPPPEAITDPLGHGGGFIPETQPSSTPPSGISEPPQHSSRNIKENSVPRIYYASRTHSQIGQVIREYKKTSYRVPMAVLASRKHYCTNPHVLGMENIDEECKLLLKNQEAGCCEFKNMHKVKCHPSLQKGGCHQVHDIEDLIKVGKMVKGCAYYAARSMADDAQLVFCPYSYIINPVIRGAMDVHIDGAIIVLDEAHNIEDICREAGSLDLKEDALLKLQMELEQLCMIDAIIYQPLYEMTQDLVAWVEQRKNTLEKKEFQHFFSTWTGDKALRQLQEAGISQQYFPTLLDCATKVIKASSDTESDVPHLSGMSVITLEGLFSSLTYFFSSNGSHIFDYELCLQRYLKKDGKNAFGSWTCSLSLWCLDPAVVFRDIANLSLSVILTSGTLSPMTSFSSELGVQFGIRLEAPHVIDVNSQVWSAIISHGPGNYPLDASYKTADTYTFQDALGKSLEEIFKVVPGGTLIFFPSYKLMEKLCNRWHLTGQWSRLNARKPLFVEPRGGNQEELETVLKGYYDSISGVRKSALRKKRRIRKTDDNVIESKEDANCEGAAFLAVFRGKVSEGIDFSDDNARVVIVVGIPFANINDIQVTLKRKYNNTYKFSKNLLSGSEWYCQQAFRALNQALGRCIRHKDDYGAIILLDQRFQEQSNKAYISKWLRSSIRKYGTFEQSVEELTYFFRDVKDVVEKNKQLIPRAKCDDASSQRKRQNDIALQRIVHIDEDGTSRDCIYRRCTYESAVALTPDNDIRQNSCLISKVESPLNPSVCSYIQKRRKSVASMAPTFIDLVDEEDTGTPAHLPGSISFEENIPAFGIIPRKIEFGDETSPAEKEPKKSNVPQSLATDNAFSSYSVIDKRLQISCLLCKTPLGRPENHLYLSCLSTELSKAYLLSLSKDRFICSASQGLKTVPVIITDVSSVDPRFCNGTLECDRGKGTWCEGCVFKNVFCPFCINPNNSLGVQVIAADEKNAQLLNKILLYSECVEMKNSEAAPEHEAAKDKVNCDNTDNTDIFDFIDPYAYTPKQQPELGGWRTVKSKLKLPRKGS